MARGAEKRRRQELLHERIREEHARNPGPELPMSHKQLAELVDHLDVWLGENACDRTLRESRHWAAEHGLDPDAVEMGLPEFGGGCDCEVVANMDWEND
jgi:hypothetical protein